MVRASASGAGCRGFDPGPGHSKDLVPVATLLGAQHYKASTGFSSPKTKYSIINIACLIYKSPNNNKKGPKIINVCIH